MSFISEFKTFAMRGNVVDLAVGVVIGGAFGKIVTALVEGVLMPVLGVLMGGINISAKAWMIKPAEIGPDGKELAAAVLFKYGAFLQSVIDFVIVAFAIFLFVKGMNKLKKKEEDKPAPPAEPAEDVKLLTEIRDLLKAERTPGP
jgi:large conductance mechanosensitive channel